MVRHVKRFANKKFIHTADLALLKRFLERYRQEITLDLDALGEDNKQTRARLYEYFLAADESYPPQMLDDLHRIAELSTEVGVAHLSHRAEMAGEELIPAGDLEKDDGLRFNCRYLALRAFLDHPDTFEAALDWLTFEDHQSPAEFVGADEDVKPHVGKPTRDAFEQQASEFFSTRYQGRYCRARLYHDEDGVNILVIHGKQPVSTLVIVGDQERPLTFRETKQDTLTYDQATGRLKVTARTEEEKKRLCEIFAATILGKPKFFDHGDCRRLCTLDPITKAGADFRLDGAQARRVSREHTEAGGMVMATIPREKQRCWEDLIAAISRESEMAGGFGELVVSIKFHKGQPQELHVIERRPHYRLGGGLPACTGAADRPGLTEDGDRATISGE